MSGPIRIAIVGDTRDFTTAMDRAGDSMQGLESKADGAVRAVEKIDGAVEGTGDRFGDLATNAGTLGGGMSDLGEKVGGTAGAFLTAGGAALQWGEAVGDIGEGLAGFIKQSKLAAIATRVWSGVTTAATAVQRGLNTAMRANPIGIIITLVALLVAGLVWFFTKTKVGQAIVKSAWAGIQKAMSAVANWWTGTLVPAAQNVWTKIQGFFGKLWRFIQTVFRYTPLGMIITNWSKITAYFGRVRDGVVARVSGMVDWLRGLPSRISSAVGNFGSLLYGKGRELIQGLINGINAMVAGVANAAGRVASTIKSFLPGSPVKVGPLRSWNNGGAGKRLMDMLASGIADSANEVDKAMQRAMSLNVDPVAINQGGGSGTASTPANLEVMFSGNGDVGAFIAAFIRDFIRKNGGNVQAVLGAR